MDQNATRDLLAPLRGKLPPGWECWSSGLAGIVYARRQGTQPPVVLRDVTADGLARQVTAWEIEQAEQPGVRS